MRDALLPRRAPPGKGKGKLGKGALDALEFRRAVGWPRPAPPWYWEVLSNRSDDDEESLLFMWVLESLLVDGPTPHSESNESRRPLAAAKAENEG